MTKKRFPIRAETHQLEELSERFFRNSLPKNWTCYRSASDYGVDLRVDLFDGQRAVGRELLVQLKSSATRTTRGFEVLRLRTATYNHLRNKLQVAMLVKFVRPDNEAYWILLRDVPEPDADRLTLSVRIPKVNRLSTIDWTEIHRHVRAVTKLKLGATRGRRGLRQ